MFNVEGLKVFPLLIMPCLAAWLVRYLFPALHRAILSKPDLAFNIWAVSLSLAIAVTVKAIVHSTMSVYLMLLIALVSLVCCALQFALGHKVGSLYGHIPGHQDERITAGQALGQKNTVFAMGEGGLPHQFSTSVTLMIRTSLKGRSYLSVRDLCILSTTSRPEMTSPKTV